MSDYDARRPSAENPLHFAQGQSFHGSSEAGSQYGSEYDRGSEASRGGSRGGSQVSRHSGRPQTGMPSALDVTGKIGSQRGGRRPDASAYGEDRRPMTADGSINTSLKGSFRPQKQVFFRDDVSPKVNELREQRDNIYKGNIHEGRYGADGGNFSPTGARREGDREPPTAFEGHEVPFRPQRKVFEVKDHFEEGLHNPRKNSDALSDHPWGPEHLPADANRGKYKPQYANEESGAENDHMWGGYMKRAQSGYHAGHEFGGPDEHVVQEEGLERGIGYGTHKVKGANVDHMTHGMNPDAFGSERERGIRTGYHVADRFDHGMVPRKSHHEFQGVTGDRGVKTDFTHAYELKDFEKKTALCDGVKYQMPEKTGQGDSHWVEQSFGEMEPDLRSEGIKMVPHANKVRGLEPDLRSEGIKMVPSANKDHVQFGAKSRASNEALLFEDHGKRRIQSKDHWKDGGWEVRGTEVHQFDNIKRLAPPDHLVQGGRMRSQMSQIDPHWRQEAYGFDDGRKHFRESKVSPAEKQFDESGISRDIGHGKRHIASPHHRIFYEETGKRHAEEKNNMVGQGVSNPPGTGEFGRKYFYTKDEIEETVRGIEPDVEKPVGRVHLTVKDNYRDEILRPLHEGDEPIHVKPDDIRLAVEEWAMTDFNLKVFSENSWDRVKIEPKGTNWTLTAFSSHGDTLTREGRTARDLAMRLSDMTNWEMRVFGFRIRRPDSPIQRNFERAQVSEGVHMIFGTAPPTGVPRPEQGEVVARGVKYIAGSGKDHIGDKMQMDAKVSLCGHSPVKQFQDGLDRGIGHGIRKFDQKSHFVNAGVADHEPYRGPDPPNQAIGRPTEGDMPRFLGHGRQHGIGPEDHMIDLGTARVSTAHPMRYITDPITGRRF